MNNKDFRIEISSDKIVDILMHTATRNDIERLNNKMESYFDRFDKTINILQIETKQEIEKLDSKIDAVEKRLDNKIDKAVETLNNKIDIVVGKLDKKIDKYIWFFIASILTPIALHFLKF